MALFRRKKSIRLNSITTSELQDVRSGIPDGIAEKCPHCQRIILKDQISKDYCCPHCNEHLHFPAPERIEWLLDSQSFTEWDGHLQTQNPVEFPQYEAKIQKTQGKTQLNEAIITGIGKIKGIPLALGIMDNRFLMASMGQVVGEKLTRLFEQARELNLPVILYISSGGARMQEGIISLMQMAKVTQAVTYHSQAGLFYGSILTHPTTGGVTASFAMQADIIMAEPRAIIGFAGKRVIQQTLNAKLADDFQTAEWVFDNGFIDQIIPRSLQKDVIHQLLTIHQGGGPNGNIL